MEQNKQFYQKLFQDLDHFPLFSDAKLLTEDGWSFDVHQFVLANKCPFFYDLFCNFPNDREPTLIPKFRGETLNEVLYFIYTDTVAFNKKNFLDIILLSDFLRIENLYNQANKFAESILSTENCLQIFATSLKLNEDSLQKLSFRIIAMNFENLRNEADFAEMPVECVKEILKDNSLLVQGENIVWESIIKWANRHPPSRFKEVRCLLKCLKLEDIDESLANGIIQSEIVSKNPYCSEIEKMTFQKFESSLDTLKHIIYSFPESPEICFSKIDNRRLPDCVNVIVCITFPASSINENKFGIYVTYDEKLDILRKVGEFDNRGYKLTSCIQVIGENLYAFDLKDRYAVRFNLCTSEWHEIENLFDGIESEVRCTAVIGSNIYLISRDFGHDTPKVKIYNTENGLKSNATPMYRMTYFQAVSFLNKIFVVGKLFENNTSRVIAQVYEQESNSWSFITPPRFFFGKTHLIAYHEQLYIMGDARYDCEVEVFNVARNEWERIDDLPRWQYVSKFVPKVFIFNDELFAVYHGEITSKQFVLNETTKTWVKPEKPLLVKNYFDTFTPNIHFHTIYDRHVINILVKQSRHPGAILEKNRLQ